MRALSAVLLLPCSAFVVACSTPYRPASLNDALPEGYSDVRLDDGYWKVEVFGNNLTSLGRLHEYLLKRSAELARSAGFDHFVVEVAYSGREAELQLDERFTPMGFLANEAPNHPDLKSERTYHPRAWALIRGFNGSGPPVRGEVFDARAFPSSQRTPSPP
jgi:hypothetical protein